MFLNIFIFVFFVSRAYTTGPISLATKSKNYPVDQCSSVGYYCNPKLKKPCCEENYDCKVLNITEDVDVFICLNKTIVGDHCRYLKECLSLENAICSYRRCTCLPNYGPSSNRTQCVPLLEGYCDEFQACYTENSVCVNNRCQCRNHFRMDTLKRCVPSSIGKSCSNDLKCGDPFHYNCKNGVCACKKNHILVNNASCLPLLNEFCWSDETCGPKNSLCINNKCQCEDHYNAASKGECVLHQNWGKWTNY